MKKLFKILIITILIAVTVALSAYVFFAHFKKEKTAFVEIQNFQKTNGEFNEKIDSLNEMYLEKTSETRFSAFCDLSKNLDSSFKYLNAYTLQAKGSEFKEEKIAKKVDALKDERKETAKLIDEYLDKAENSELFNVVESGDVVIKQIAIYFKEYAKTVSYLNSNIVKIGIDSSSDANFTLIDIYCNVVDYECSNLTLDTTEDVNYVVFKGDNTAFMNTKFTFNGQVKNNYTKEMSEFINAYNNCDKEIFAKKLATNYAQANGMNVNKEINATYLLKKALGEVA